MPRKPLSERRAARLAKSKPSPDQFPGTADAGALPTEGIPHGGIPHQVITPPPMPSVSGAMATGGLPLVRGNSNQDPMTPEGHATVQGVGQDLARLGGPDEIIPSTSRRAQETGSDVAAETGLPLSQPIQGMESHALGQLEGEQKTPEVKRFLRDMIRKAPDARIPGQGALSNRPGESFNEFRQRVGTAVRGLMQRLATNPTSRILVPTSSQVIRLVKAWCNAGCPDDFSVDTNEMTKDDAGNPGEIERLFPEPSGMWGVTPFDPKTAQDFQPGIYLMRHGQTNSVQETKAANHQKSRAQVVAHIRAGNYAGAREVGKSAVDAGHLTDDEVSQAIDESLPNAQTAPQFPPHELLAAASAASPAKRAELMPTLQQHFADLSGVEPRGQHQLRSHLGRLGLRQ